MCGVTCKVEECLRAFEKSEERDKERERVGLQHFTLYD